MDEISLSLLVFSLRARARLDRHNHPLRYVERYGTQPLRLHVKMLVKNHWYWHYLGDAPEKR